jgi:predicted DNA-binding transcriptional regulator AlpA
MNLLTTKEAAAVLKLRPQTLRSFRSKGGSPVFVRLSQNRIAYAEEDLRAWIESRKRKSTADPGPGRAA